MVECFIRVECVNELNLPCSSRRLCYAGVIDVVRSKLGDRFEQNYFQENSKYSLLYVYSMSALLIFLDVALARS